MELPVVNHKDYFAKIGDDHKFPITKFGDLADYLIKKKIVKKFLKPYPCSVETLKKAHSEEYINNIKNKTTLLEFNNFISNVCINFFFRCWKINFFY